MHTYVALRKLPQNGQQSPHERGEQHGHRQIHMDQEPNEVALIMIPDAVVNPRTVMVHFQHAAFALRAVMGARRLVSVALVAVAAGGGRVVRGIVIAAI